MTPRITIISILLLTYVTSLAYLSPRMSLHELINESEIIAVVRVNSNETLSTPRGKVFDRETGDSMVLSTSGPELSIMSVLETLKGSLNTYSIQVIDAVSRHGNPVTYENGSRFLVFLYRDSINGPYRTYGLGYGSKNVNSDHDLEIYKTRIKEFFEISKIVNVKQRKRLMVEWQIRCAIEKCTRFEGAQELYKYGHRSYYSWKGSSQKRLNKRQIYIIDSIFFSTDTISLSELMLTGIILKEHKQKMNEQLLKNLKYADFYFAKDLMSEYLYFNPDIRLKYIKDLYDRLYYFDPNRNDIQTWLVEQFVWTANRAK